MTVLSNTRSLHVTMFGAFFLICTLNLHVRAFSLTNCTVQGTLDDITHLKVLCYNMGFFMVPAPIPTNVRSLDIAVNSISHIKSHEFKDLWNLRELNVSQNRISWIQKGTNQHFPNLTHLNLANNKLQLVSKDLLDGLTNLKVLRLDGNIISRLEIDAFEMLPNLNLLNLTNNNLQFISMVKPVFSSSGLMELLIGNNNFSTFNSYDWSHMTLGVKKIDISNNPLTEFQISENIFSNLDLLDLSNCGNNKSILWNITDKTFLNSVKTLNLSGMHVPHENITTLLQHLSWASLNKLRLSHLKKVEDLIQYACLPELKVLRLKGNGISVLKDLNFKPCSGLTELELADNLISEVSAAIFQDLTQLQLLHLQVNSLNKVNNAFQNLTNLIHLDLSRNRIHELTCLDFANLTQLKQLYLFGNRISEISPCVFKDLKNLEVLKLGTNNLLTVGRAFENILPSLKDLQLTFNYFKTLQKYTFKDLSNLQNLKLSDNQISEIDPHAFAGLVSLTDLSLSSNRITAKTIQDPTIFSDMHNLTNLDLFSNIISFTHDTLHSPPFVHLKSLKTLTIHSQRRGINKIPTNLLQGLTSLEKFYGGNMNLNNLHPDTFTSTPKVWFLDLSKNTFSDENSITAEVFHPIPMLTNLVITRSQLHSLNFLINANLSILSELQAKENTLDVINCTWIQSLPHLRMLDLRKNTFTCDCSNAFFLDWAIRSNSTQVQYLNKYTCSYPPALRGTQLSNLNLESCAVNIEFICFVSSCIWIIVTMLGSFIYAFFRWQVLYAYYLFLAFLYDSRKKQTQQQHGFQYDAFISYNAQDESWVVDELLPHLEGEQGWRLCLHHRDFEPGKCIIDNIMDGIYNSRKTICLITNNYLRSTWCSKEIQMANFRLFDEQKDVLILVFLEDIPAAYLSPYHQMRKLIKKKTYLKWPKPGENTGFFWQKLRLALETKEAPEDEETILSGIKENQLQDRFKVNVIEHR